MDRLTKSQLKFELPEGAAFATLERMVYMEKTYAAFSCPVKFNYELAQEGKLFVVDAEGNHLPEESRLLCENVIKAFEVRDFFTTGNFEGIED